MITVQTTQSYSIKNASEMAFEIEYTDGTKVRAVESKDRFIRKEWLKNGSWVQVGKPYIISKDKSRAAESIKKTVMAA